MNSFDFYDTLVARKSITDSKLVGDAELENLIPVQEMISKVKPDDIIISDYDYPEIVKRGVKEVCGLDNQVVVTQDGKLTGKIWELYRPDKHVGDNLHSDYASPLAAGLSAELVNLCRPTEIEQHLFNNGFENLSRWVREARLKTYGTYRTAELNQIELNFPLLYLATSLLYGEMKYYDRVLMSSRDCCLWQVLQKKLALGAYHVEYFYTSRKARNTASQHYLKYVNSLLTPTTLVVDLCGTGESLPRFLEKTKYPDTKVLLLGKYHRPEVNKSDCFLHIADSYIERLNVARHSCVVDIDDAGFFVVSNPANINWNSDRIAASHNAFLTAIRPVDDICHKPDCEILNMMRYFINKIVERKDEILEDDVVLLDDM